MADFCQWATAAESAIGLHEGGFVELFARNQESANLTALSASPVARVVCELVHEFDRDESAQMDRDRPSDGIELDCQRRRQRLLSWPKAGNALSGKIKRVAPNLRQAGIGVVFEGPTADDKRKLIGFRKMESNIKTLKHRNSEIPPTCGRKSDSMYRSYRYFATLSWGFGNCYKNRIGERDSNIFKHPHRLHVLPLRSYVRRRDAVARKSATLESGTHSGGSCRHCNGRTPSR